MSLLLEALKKAELAKQSAMAEHGTDAEDTRSVDIPLEPTLEERPQPVVTRESLPGIGESIDIHPEDLRPTIAAQLPPEQARPVPPQSALATEPRPASPAPPERPAAREPEFSAQPEREAARQLFDVKEVDYNPRRPFQITVGTLIALGIGYGAYVWWQMQPRSSYSTTATRTAPPAPPPVATGPATPPQIDPLPAGPPGASVASPGAVAGTPPGTAPVIATGPRAFPSSPLLPARPANVPDPSTPGTAPPAPPQPGGLFTPTPATRAPAGTPPARTARAATPEAPERSPITVTPPSAQVDQSLERAYSAYQRGEIDAARDEYLKLLAREPNHRDALLGLAAIDVRTRNFDTAEMRYVRLLEIDPRDAHAHAGLIALNGTTDPVQSESRLKSLIAGQPDATHLYFSLGNQYAVQGRWGEAQDAYFKAFRADPDNPDFAYNLAVSLDHLRQAPLAAEYYRRAVSLAAQRPAAFERAGAERRARELVR